MMSSEQPTPLEAQGPPAEPADYPPLSDPAAIAAQAQQRRLMTGIIAGVVVILIALIGAVYLLLLPSTDTGKIRDVFIIVMALESLVIGMSLIVLMFQMAKLINLLQNEIKPILESTQETANTLRGTTVFLSDHLAEPVVKLNEYLAALRSMLGVLGVNRKR